MSKSIVDGYLADSGQSPLPGRPEWCVIMWRCIVGIFHISSAEVAVRVGKARVGVARWRRKSAGSAGRVGVRCIADNGCLLMLFRNVGSGWLRIIG